ncbi:hypothetical protein [Streptomyces sp. NPDC053427]|uniref:hypothetical protein n=1 Tax=Streptomyces sp. NPDC053427 TaxID=3365701 RepID=UPI0037D1BAED
MHVVIAWWDLAESSQTIDSLRTYLRDESVTAFTDVPGLRLKTWISDRAANRWGAVLLWESREAAAQPLPGRAPELIGYPPAARFAFDVEATVEGRYTQEALAGLGLAFTQ